MSHAGHDHAGHNHGDMGASKATGAPSVSDKNTASDGSASASASADSAHAGHGGGDDVHMNMSPFLFTRKTGFFILFREALVGSTGGFVGALFACFAFGALTSLGMEIGKRFERRAQIAKATGAPKALPLSIVGSIVHGLRLLLHYTAMLIVMTMNVWIIIAVLLGHALGFFLALNFLRGKVAGKQSDESSSDLVEADGACHC